MQNRADRGRAWLAYAVNLQGRHGEARLCTSAEPLLLEIRSEAPLGPIAMPA